MDLAGYTQEDVDRWIRELAEPRLSSEEIQERIDAFNATNDWSVFNDVPPSQHVCIMYPHRIDMNRLNLTIENQRKIELNTTYGKCQKNVE